METKPEGHPARKIVVRVLASLAVLAVIALLAIPGNVPSRALRNDGSTLGDLHTIASAEATYQLANQGYADQLACLATPSSCIPGSSRSMRFQGLSCCSKSMQRRCRCGGSRSIAKCRSFLQSPAIWP